MLDRAYGAVLQVPARRRDGWCVRLERLDAGEVITGDLRLDGELTSRVQGRQAVVIGTLLSGTRRVEEASGSLRAGDVYVASHPQASWTVHLRDARVHTVSLPASLFPAAPWAGRSPEPVAGGARQWRRTTRLIDDLLASDDVAVPHIAGPAARLLAATVLAIFPGAAAAPDEHPGTLRRAIAFIDGNSERDIAVADIAVAARVTPRAVQLAFRRHMDTTPTAYLRQVRLRRAHRELLDASPGEGMTVTSVALRWGFANPSHFSAHYRDAFGAPPSDTLRR